jgi:uncharacterized protein YcfJ
MAENKNQKQTETEHNENGTFHKVASAALRGSTEAWAGVAIGALIGGVIGLATNNSNVAKAVWYGTAATGLIHGAVSGWQDLEKDNELIRENATLKKESKNWQQRIEVMQEKAEQAGLSI